MGYVRSLIPRLRIDDVAGSRDLRKYSVHVALLATVLVGAASIGRLSGRFLVLNEPRSADAIVVLADDVYPDDEYYWKALQLLRASYGSHLLIPADPEGPAGQTDADEGSRFVQATAGEWRKNVLICREDDDEYASIDNCLRAVGAHRVLMVAPAVESRRLRLLYSRHLPQYSWSVAAINDARIFGERWWSKRQWAKEYVQNWQGLISAVLLR